MWTSKRRGDASCDDISMSMSMSMSMSKSMNMNMEMDMEKRQKREARLHKRIQRALDMTGNIYSKKDCRRQGAYGKESSSTVDARLHSRVFQRAVWVLYEKEKDAGVCQAASKVYTVQHGGLLGSCYHGHSPISIENPGR